MAKRKTPLTTPGEQIAQQILDNYDIKSAEDVQDVLKQIFAPIFESMLKGEMENHLGHKNHERSEDGGNVRNGYSSKRLKTSLGEVPIRVPRDRQSTFEPQIIKKHQRDVSSIEGKVLAMYARGMSQRDIAATIEDIYGFQMSHEQISTITDCVTEEVEAWRNRPLQRCIVHLIRNSIRYIPRKQWSAFTKQLKLIYGAINVKQARQEFEKFKTDWQAYPGTVSVWENNFSHVEQLYNYGSAVRKIMYTNNAIESVNSSFRKVTKKGAFPNEDAVFKIFYLRILELYKKWEGRHVANWAMVRNQLLMDDRMSQLMQQYDVAY
ncbi:IS256 family transposase [Mitsuokella sp. AF33-22]|uniref:transposase n=1 Tax=Mitsuokella sp. AF33-22 TaxID=2292047 RepID=UPI000E50F66C|nr:transposase [Mitsuokella sp. AF33-22]RHM57658.1 IS256 family transposase [Mitsuokella sp. AF33-22]